MTNVSFVIDTDRIETWHLLDSQKTSFVLIDLIFCFARWLIWDTDTRIGWHFLDSSMSVIISQSKIRSPVDGKLVLIDRHTCSIYKSATLPTKVFSNNDHEDLYCYFVPSTRLEYQCPRKSVHTDSDCRLWFLYLRSNRWCVFMSLFGYDLETKCSPMQRRDNTHDDVSTRCHSQSMWQCHLSQRCNMHSDKSESLALHLSLSQQYHRQSGLSSQSIAEQPMPYQ